MIASNDTYFSEFREYLKDLKIKAVYKYTMILWNRTENKQGILLIVLNVIKITK